MRLLLISNSTNYGGNYLDHCADEIKDFLGTIKSLTFIPYALHDWNGYVEKTRTRYAQMGIAVKGIQEYPDPKTAIQQSEAIHIGGGNTYRLLKTLYELELVPLIRERVKQGMPYIGASAGTNVATLSIKTTNDMPITYPPSFDALQLVPFNINPHYIDPDPNSMHMGETREQRIKEFHEMNDSVVVGLREGTYLRVENNTMILKGLKGARLFRKETEPEEFPPMTKLDFLLNA
jgi:dipeptidase E